MISLFQVYAPKTQPGTQPGTCHFEREFACFPAKCSRCSRFLRKYSAMRFCMSISTWTCTQKGVCVPCASNLEHFQIPERGNFDFERVPGCVPGSRKPGTTWNTWNTDRAYSSLKGSLFPASSGFSSKSMPNMVFPRSSISSRFILKNHRVASPTRLLKCSLFRFLPIWACS